MHERLDLSRIFKHGTRRLSLRKQQRNGLNGTVKRLDCFLTWEKSRALLFSVNSPNLQPKRFVSFYEVLTWRLSCSRWGVVFLWHCLSYFLETWNFCKLSFLCVISYRLLRKFFLLGNDKFMKWPLLREYSKRKKNAVS